MYEWTNSCYQNSLDLTSQLSCHNILDQSSWESISGRLFWDWETRISKPTFQAWTAELKMWSFCYQSKFLGTWLCLRCLSWRCDTESSLSQSFKKYQDSCTLASQSFYNDSVLHKEVTRGLTGNVPGSHSPAMNTRFLFCILEFLTGPSPWISFLWKTQTQMGSC